MHHLLIDTCVWVNLGKKHQPQETLRKLSDLVDRGKVKLIVPQTIIDEWERNKKAKVVDDMTRNIPHQANTAKGLAQFLPVEKAEQFVEILNWFKDHKNELEAPYLEKMEAISNLLAYSTNINIQIEDQVKLEAVTRALEKKAPFHERSSMGDALILLSTIDYLRENPVSHCFFVSNDKTDFTSPSDRSQIHEDLKELLEQNNIKFFNNIGRALNEIEDSLVSEAEIAEIEAEQLFETINQSAMLEAIAANQFSESLEKLEPIARSIAKIAADYERIRQRSLVNSAAIMIKALEDFQVNRQKIMESLQRTLEIGLPQLASTIRNNFVSYVNLSNQSVTIHRKACRYYTNRTADETKNGYWSPVIGNQNPEREIRYCKVCLPNMQKSSTPTEQ